MAFTGVTNADGQQHPGIQHAVWRPQQEVSSRKNNNLLHKGKYHWTADLLLGLSQIIRAK